MGNLIKPHRCINPTQSQRIAFAGWVVKPGTRGTMKYNIRIVEQNHATHLEPVTGYEVKTDKMRAFVHRTFYYNKSLSGWWIVTEYYTGASGWWFLSKNTRKETVEAFLDYARTKDKSELDKKIDRMLEKFGYSNGSEKERNSEKAN